jgi:hypothetical protein
MTRLCALIMATLGLCTAQDRHDWKSVSGLNPGDKVQLSLKTGKSITGLFTNWTTDGVTVDTATVKREEVKEVYRFVKGGHLKRAGIGALIGFGGGFAMGAAAGGCHPGEFLCIGRGKAGAIVGGAGLVVGAAIGALLPSHRKEAIYDSQ